MHQEIDNYGLDLETQQKEVVKYLLDSFEFNSKPETTSQKPFSEWFHRKKDDLVTVTTESMVIIGSSLFVSLIAPFDLYNRLKKTTPMATLVFAPPIFTFGTSLASGDNLGTAALKSIGSLAAEGLLIAVLETKIKR